MFSCLGLPRQGRLLKLLGTHFELLIFCQHHFRLFNVLRHCVDSLFALDSKRTAKSLAIESEFETAGAEMQSGASAREPILRIGR